MTINQLMTHDVVACRRGDTVARAAQLMWERDIGVVPVIDDRRTIVGMITDRDITMACLLRGRAPSQIVVNDVMTRALIWCTPRESVAAITRRMSEYQVRRIAVVDDDGCLIGMVSIADLARAYARGGGVSDGCVAMLLADVGAPRSPGRRLECVPMPAAPPARAVSAAPP